MISKGGLCHKNNMWISFRSLPVFPARVGKGNRFTADDDDGNLGLD